MSGLDTSVLCVKHLVDDFQKVVEANKKVSNGVVEFGLLGNCLFLDRIINRFFNHFELG